MKMLSAIVVINKLENFGKIIVLIMINELFRANFNEVSHADYYTPHLEKILSLKIQKVPYICWNFHFAI